MYDVIIVGAGPAGSTAAKHTAENGLDTIILEKQKLPRKKPCAGLVSQRALNNLEVEIPESLIKRRCYGTRVIYKKHVLESKLDSQVGIQVSRSEFDYYLVQQAANAGAKVLDNTLVNSVYEDKDYISINTNEGLFKSRFLIGADGVNSVCSRYISGVESGKKAFSLNSDVPVSVEYINSRYSDLTEVDFGIVKNGYFWAFPKDIHISVGMGIFGNTSKSKPLNAYKANIKNKGFDYKKPQGHFIPIGGYKRKICSSRILLAGDAAGFVDAFLGEGVPYAIMSGKIAANTIIETFKDNNFSDDKLSDYVKKCDDAFKENLKYSLIFSKLFYRFPSIFATMLTNNKTMLDHALLVVKGESGYKQFVRWLVPRFPYYIMKILKNRSIHRLRSNN
ncbi:NAD(P)/FAD-dependent oxidoreductase [Methanohalobium sp.]|uniref:geranylgeranyl reductase family protein n=1 Tax=Methanohalobium sp. TaxID=2837493 RepID=UPI0025DE60C2|nr:NAD(P)/FAD-dependent oxidoreductase [Methanohalobium sp.]